MQRSFLGRPCPVRNMPLSAILVVCNSFQFLLALECCGSRCARVSVLLNLLLTPNVQLWGAGGAGAGYGAGSGCNGATGGGGAYVEGNLTVTACTLIGINVGGAGAGGCGGAPLY